MKELSIFLLVVTMIYSVVSTDATSCMVAFAFFCHTCGKDIIDYWNRSILHNN